MLLILLQHPSYQDVFFLIIEISKILFIDSNQMKKDKQDFGGYYAFFNSKCYARSDIVKILLKCKKNCTLDDYFF